ncbi:tRNA lysidine(34) synthetase TilS [Bacteroidota bacterium]
MEAKFSDFIKVNSLCDSFQQVMLAVSGGIDSVVMADLFSRSGYSFIILHCNFMLRGAESDGDEAFVRSLAAKYDAPVFVKHFETEAYAEENGISIQMAARKLRYDWFDEAGRQQGIERIATAHNLNDSVETILLNLARGTGIRGLTGIPIQTGKYIRPLLFASRNEIQEYAEERNIAYRVDSSNASRKYKRNMIRHDLLPLFEELNPSFLETMNENSRRLKETFQIYRKEVERVRGMLFSEKENHVEISIASLKELSPLSSWLYELFSDYGFSIDQCINIEKILESDSGKQFISTSYRLYKDRNYLLLYRIEDSAFDRYYIDSPESKAVLPFAMDIEILDKDTLGTLPDDPSIACLDLDKLNFPLTIRKWQHGDYFFPLGMEQIKKLSDFFIDNKVPVPEKNNTWILTSGKNIVWIMGHRIDNRFKISSATKQILKLQLYK